MKKLVFIPLLIFVVTGYTIYSCKKSIAPEKAIAQTVAAQIDDFIDATGKLLDRAQSGNADEKALQNQFLQLRLNYKKFEWAAEYFNSGVARFINGPPVQEVEVADGAIFEPAGLQVVEGYLFPKYNPANKKDLIAQIKTLQDNARKIKPFYTNIDMFDWQVFDAGKQEIFRILALGITGFDNPLTLKSSEESIAALNGVKAAMAYYEDNAGDENLSAEFTAAAKYLAENTDFNGFDRAAFITKYGNPITTGITDLQNKLNIHGATYNRLLKMDAKTLFDKDAFNVNAYAPDFNSFVTEKKTALGRLLFSDPILSGNGKRSCQSCHQPDKAFTDGLVKNIVIDGNKPVKRNTPTLLNAALQSSQFYDLRAATLEDQALSVVQNKDEMHGSMKAAAQRLWENKSYRQLFTDAFKTKNRTGIDTLEVMNAIGSYVRSLVSLNSRFDQYMRGNKAALNQEEINGFNIFMGKAKCATCHYMPLFNGAFPPMYILNESEVIGVPQTIAKTAIDTDMGRYNILKTNSFKHAFKISTVRNAALTAPYMHNGVFTTLEQVMDFYNKGGGAGLGYKVDNQTLSPDKLNLTDKESKEVIAFIKALNQGS
ncbi:cytochrome C peroxidase [Mucilaginibacter corticis]|uniref:Cytochrome C peroxidase n=1 Tax=Mucilaginibacter corticis TaxID=2597670 RepID=A0A556MT93_9SPHI|nr:cytochrome c peroxidase [Mucilaginibacter corticis]TSJ43161.1 cytochrome C peroxidase [Mucilaginibacter corticis]